jgi:two-component system cell cycle sensor histidine kinase/response regulator CckA
MSTILVVDDEQPIRQLVARVLERKGHRVIACQNASEALAVTDLFDLLVVDLVLPELNGRELTEKLRERQPELPVVLMSGFLSQREMMPGPPSTFLQKPMLPGAVVEAVDKLLRTN